MKRWSERIKDLGNAVERLNEAIEDSNNYKLETLKDSVIHRFEFSLELSWKALKNYLNSQGILEATTPKQTIKEAFGIGILKNGQVWLDMLNDRNRTSNTYNQLDSNEIYENIVNIYYKEMLSNFEFLKTKEIDE
jgi:nucleotidyltransferase substrate binding protein (TIGR01987 family)